MRPAHNHKALGVTPATIIHIKTLDSVSGTNIGRQLAKIQKIRKVHWIAGEFDYLLKAKINTTDSLTALLQKIRAIQRGTDSRTTPVPDTLKKHQTISVDLIDQEKKVRS
jgi:Lrp/AsnC family transcriptional regulator, leucine-responsive regulatory protein